MNRIAAQLVQPLRENKYLIGYGEGVVTIKSASWNPRSFAIFSPVVGGALFLAGLDYKIVLMGVLAMLVPLLYDKWQFPKKIEFDTYARDIRISKGLLMNSTIAFGDVADIYAEKSALWSDVSAFQEGNKDHIYKVFVSVKSGKIHRLLRLQFRRELDKDVTELTGFFKALKNVK